MLRTLSGVPPCTGYFEAFLDNVPMGTFDFAARGGPAVISIVSVRNSIFIPFEVLGLLTDVVVL